MRSTPFYMTGRGAWRTIVLALLAVAAGVLFAFEGWLESDKSVEFCSLILAAIAVAAATPRRPRADRRGAMPPTFVLDFAALLLVGVRGASLVAAVGAFMKGRVADRDRAADLPRTILDIVTAVASIEAAGFAYGALGGTAGGFLWPAQAVLTAGALTAYLLAHAATHIVSPLFAGRSIDRASVARVVHEAPMFVVGASVSAAIAAAIDQRAWDVLAIVAVPLFFGCRVYVDYIARVEEDDLRRELVGHAQGMALLDLDGRVTTWSDAFGRLVGCSRERAIGASLTTTVPSLRETPLPRAISDAAQDRRARIVPAITIPAGGGFRTVDIRVVPVDAGVTLLCDDAAERTRSEQGLRRAVDRLTLAADGANDALWEWDLRTKEFYVSPRWNAMLGISQSTDIIRLEDWIDRVHPEDATALDAAMKAHLAGRTEVLEHEHRIRHEDGTYRWFLCHGRRSAGGRPSRIAGSLTDITDRVAAHERLRTAAFLDPLTGLRNRADFVEVLGRRLEHFKSRGGPQFAVLYLDLDRFKVVNDSLGHLVGDELLIAVSRRLEACLRENDCIGRLGGDEFAILLDAVNDEGQANAVAFRIQDAFKAPLSIGGREVFTSASIGIAVGRVEYSTPDEIMRDADAAMYHAKSNGKARHELFDADMHARARGRLSLENDLRRAVEADDFEVHYQPIVLLATGMCVGFESLIRWTRPNGEKVSPAIFIPIAEDLGLIDRIGTWVLNRACLTFADWQRRFPHAGLTCITVNASSRQLTQGNYPYLVEQALQKSRLKAQDLRIEVTETALMDAPQLAAMVLSELRDFGVKVYLDDFGTGCSSLSHLHKLPVDALKVDRSFVMSLLMPERPAIVESILALARTMKTSVVAEGIEDDVQARELERLGCTHAQGYLFSKPLSMQQVEALIASPQPLGHKRLQYAHAPAPVTSQPRYSPRPVPAVCRPTASS